MPPMSQTCPFNSLAYAAGQGHLGLPDSSSCTGLTILRRPVPPSAQVGLGTDAADGIGPWPYVWIRGDEDLQSLHTDFPHLVTLSVVTQPGYRPPREAVDAPALKDHYVYDPSLPAPRWSTRTRARIAAAEVRGTFAVTRSPDRVVQMAELYHRFVERRGLVGAYVDFGPPFFATVAGLESGYFFEVRDTEGVAAMACGVVFEDMLQVLHTASSDDGLRWSASYLLMAGMQDFARERGLRMLTGGLPAGGRPGLARFKARWANTMVPVHLLRIVNDRQRYDEICAAVGSTRTGFFPAYRAGVVS